MSPHRPGRGIVWAAALASALAAFWACGITPGDKFCGTEVQDPNEIIFGCAVDNDGPAKGVRVTAYVADIGGALAKHAGSSGPDSLSEPLPHIDSAHLAFTDETGRFSFTQRLPVGNYNLLFEDTSESDTTKRHIQWYRNVKRDPSQLTILDHVELAKPRTLIIQVKSQADGSLLEQARCTVEGAGLSDTTKGLGVIEFRLPPGRFPITCTKGDYYWMQTDTVEVGEDKTTEKVFYLKSLGGDGFLDPPANFLADYDSISGSVRLTWTPDEVQKPNYYGVRRTDIGFGASWHLPVPTVDTFFNDALFSGRDDSLQSKTVQYNLYSLRSDAGYKGTASILKVTAPRPVAFGARVEVTLLNGKPKYIAGDTALVVVAWSNAIRANATLLWRVKGRSDTLLFKDSLSRAGRDTLPFRIPGTGAYDVGAVVVDSAGYRSWGSLLLPSGL